MNPTFLSDILNDVRFSLASVLAIWMSLLVPMVLMVVGVLAIGGGAREAGAVIFAAAVFSAADWIFLVLRFAEDADEDESRVSDLIEMPVLAMAKVLSRRYL